MEPAERRFTSGFLAGVSESADLLPPIPQWSPAFTMLTRSWAMTSKSHHSVLTPFSALASRAPDLASLAALEQARRVGPAITLV